MSATKIIAYIAAGILVFFGVLFIWGAFGQEGQPSWIFIGIVTVLIGFGIILIAEVLFSLLKGRPYVWEGS